MAGAPAGHLLAEHGQDDPEHAASLSTTFLQKRLSRHLDEAKLDDFSALFATAPPSSEMAHHGRRQKDLAHHTASHEWL
eukprot:7850247-Prorocentrum_lima.AAC.1